MIQRIQSVYLILVFVLMTCLLFMPAVEMETAGGAMTWSLYLTCGLSALLALVAVFLYKNRKTQIRVCYGVLVALVLSYLSMLVEYLLPATNKGLEISFCFPIVFPALAMILDLLAIRGIRKDEKLVRSADRLR